MVRQNGAFLDIAGLEARDIGWNADALAGLGYSPEAFNVSAYLEYRYRQAGYGKEDWDGIRALYPPGQAAAFQGIPRFQTAVHSLGLHVKSADDIAGRYSWSATCLYLTPDGLYLSAQASAKIIEQCSVSACAGGSLLAGTDAETALSEMALFPYGWRFSLAAAWKINAKE